MSHAVLFTSNEAHVRQAVQLLDRIFPPPRSFTLCLWNGYELPADAASKFGLVIKHPGALRRMFSPPIELSLGEAYIHGDFDIVGDITAAYKLLSLIFDRTFSLPEIAVIAKELFALPITGPARVAGRGPAQLRGAVHSRERDRAAIQYHYDVGNEFYALWLDRRLIYSCAYFSHGTEDIDTAQENKLEHICRKLRLKPGERLLDIGCGWGGLALYAAEKYQVQVLGVTLSASQAGYAQGKIGQAGLADRVSVRLQDYRDLQAGTFDKIVSVGMFEHVGRSHLPEYFTQAQRLLKPGGLFLNHGISSWPGLAYAVPRSASAWRKFIARRILGANSFSQHYIFPDGELVPVSEANHIAENAGLEIRDVENLREHYALTLRHWANRLEQHRAEAIGLTDEVTYRTWQLHLTSAIYGFETGNINVNQTLMSKPINGRSNLPLTRTDLYA